jgi:hypothetical protein
MNDEIRRLWAQTRVFVWPQIYALVSLPLEALPLAASLIAASTDTFAALLLEADEVSLTIDETVWQEAAADGVQALSVAGPYRAITLQLNIDLGVSGYLLPAASLLAEAGISIVPQCGYLKDHLLIRAEQTDRAVKILEGLVNECASSGVVRNSDGAVST